MFRPTLLIITAIALLSIQAFAQNKPFVSTEGRFSIALPSEGFETGPMVDHPDLQPGGKNYKWMFTKELIAFNVSFADGIWPKKGEEAVRANLSADGLIEAFQKRGSRLISRREIKLGNYPGVEVRYADEKGELTYLTRYYYAESRVYTLLGVWMSKQKEAKVLRILSTFKVIERSTPQK